MAVLLCLKKSLLYRRIVFCLRVFLWTVCGKQKTKCCLADFFISLKENMFRDNVKIDSLPIKGSLVILNGISKSFGSREIFSGIDMVVNDKDRIAIVGPNGTGKSTLLKIIVGLTESGGGELQRNKNIRIGYLPQETHWNSLKNKLIDEMKSADEKIFNLICGKKRYELLIADTKREDSEKKLKEYGEIVSGYEAKGGYKYENSAEEILKDFNFSEKDWERAIRSLSGGEKTRLALAKIILLRPNMLVLDEPTNHLDLEAINWLENFLAGWSGAIIAVSHDRRFLDLICDKTFELEKNCLEKYYCNYSAYLEEKEKNKHKKEEAYKRQEKHLAKQQKFIDRFRYKATKARAVQSRIKMLEKIEKINPPEKNAKKIRIKLNIPQKLPRKVLEFENLFVGNDEFPLAVFEGNWAVEKTDKIGVIGPNGAGKSTFLKTLIGKNKILEGSIKFYPGVKTGYYAQAHEELDPEKNILEEVKFKTKESEEKIRHILGALLFSKGDVYKEIRDLSGGERARVAIAELILNDSNMLLLDEPTNHLDIESKNSISEVLKNFDGPIILVSHDRFVLNEVCNVIWEIKNNEAKKYLGSYDDYARKKKIM